MADAGMAPESNDPGILTQIVMDPVKPQNTTGAVSGAQVTTPQMPGSMSANLPQAPQGASSMPVPQPTVSIPPSVPPLSPARVDSVVQANPLMPNMPELEENFPSAADKMPQLHTEIPSPTPPPVSPAAPLPFSQQPHTPAVQTPEQITQSFVIPPAIHEEAAKAAAQAAPHIAPPVSTPAPTPPAAHAAQPVSPHTAPASQSPMPHSVMPPEPPASKSAKNIPKIIGTTLGLLFAVAALGAGGILAAYRFAPQQFYKYAPPVLASRINAVWPLHTEFSEMLPQNTQIYGTITFGANNQQTSQFHSLLKRMPGVDEAQVNSEKTINDYLKSRYNLSLADDIKPALGDTLYVAVPTMSNNSAQAYAALKIKDFTKAQALLSKVQSSTANKIVQSEETYNGVTIYLLQTPKLNLPINGSLLQTLSHTLLSEQPVAAAAVQCAKTFTTCAQDTNSSLEATVQSPSIALIDNFLVLGDSVDSIKQVIDIDHSRSANLHSSEHFAKVQSSNQSSLFSIYLNLGELNHVFSGSSAGSMSKKLSAGLNGEAISISAENSGMVMRSSLNFTQNLLDPNMAKIFATPVAASAYAKTLPATTAVLYENAELGSFIKTIATSQADDKQTVDDVVKAKIGTTLTSMGDLLTGRYAISYQPQAKSGIVLQTPVTDGAKMNEWLSAVLPKLTALPGVFSGTRTENINGTPVTVLSFSDIDEATKPYFELSYAVKGNQLVISTNLAGMQEVLTPQIASLADDARFKADMALIGDQQSSFWNIHTKKLYNGVVQTIRDLTGNKDIGQSNQEKVIDAYLDVFPSISSGTKNGAGLATAQMSMPIVELEKARFDDIANIVKTDSTIWAWLPFVSALPNNSTDTSGSAADKAQDTTRKSNLSEIATAVVRANANFPDFQLYKTNGDEKLDPSTGVMKQLIDAGLLKSTVVDPEWPTYYYSLTNNGTTITASGLTKIKVTKAEGNCQEPTQIRDRWTYCVLQK